MNSKNFKKKLTSNFKMGQKITTLASPSKCSIFRVDDDVKFVVEENSDESEYSPPVPTLQNVKSIRKTFPKRNSAASPGISIISKEPFDLSLLPKAFEPLNYTSNGKDSPLLQHHPGMNSHPPSKKKDVPVNCKNAYKNSSKDVKCKRKATFPENETSSDSDIEVIEVKVVNPGGMNLNIVKKANSQNSLNSRKKFKLEHNNLEKKTEGKVISQHVSASCFMTGNELVVNEADPAPHLPNNPNLFSNEHASSIKWLDATLESVNVSQRNISASKREEKNSDKTQHLPELKQQHTNKSAKSRELKNLYKNLNEISWGQESSFKKLLRNPDFIRHSERNTARIARTAKTLGKRALENNKKSAILKKNSIAKSSIKKRKLAVLNSNKKLSSLKKMKTVSKVAKLRTKQPSSRASFKKLSLKNTDSEIDIKPHVEKFNKSVSIMENLKQKNSKKHSLNSKNKTKNISSKTKMNLVKSKNLKSKLTVSSKKLQLPVKTENSKPSSGSQSSVCSSVFDDSKLIDDVQSMKAPNEQENKDTNTIKLLKKLKKDSSAYTAARQGSKCQVRVQPLEHTNLWSNDCYETSKKQFLQQSFRKAVQKKEPSPYASMLQELNDSYLTPSVPKKKKPEEEVLRSSARQSEVAYRNKEIFVKKFEKYIQFIIVPNPAKKNCLTIEAIKELKNAFLAAKKDHNCHAVLISSSGPYFCNGIDMSQLIGSNKKQACEEMANVVNDLTMVLGQFSKPVVAAVNGTTIGFGVSLLTYCDSVLASDKATFWIPSNSLGYIPEGGVTLTLPQVVGTVWASEMLLRGVRITAEQAYQKGLVSEVVWPNRLMNVAVPRMEFISSQPLQVMEATKLLLRANYWDKLKTHLELERRILSSNLLSAECQINMKNFIVNGLYIMD